MSEDKLEEMIKRHEGYRRYPYKDTLGVLTIGYGANLDHWWAYGMSENEAEALLMGVIKNARVEASTALPFWNDLNAARQAVLIDMVYNMGIRRVLGFKRMIKAIKAQNWKQARLEMLDSKWATQVGDRAIELADMMLSGAWPNKKDSVPEVNLLDESF